MIIKAVTVQGKVLIYNFQVFQDLLGWLVILIFQIKDHQAIGQNLLADLQFSRERRKVPQSFMCGLPAFPVERVAGSRMGNDS